MQRTVLLNMLHALNQLDSFTGIDKLGKVLGWTQQLGTVYSMLWGHVGHVVEWRIPQSISYALLGGGRAREAC